MPGGAAVEVTLDVEGEREPPIVLEFSWKVPVEIISLVLLSEVEGVGVDAEVPIVINGPLVPITTDPPVV